MPRKPWTACVTFFPPEFSWGLMQCEMSDALGTWHLLRGTGIQCESGLGKTEGDWAWGWGGEWGYVCLNQELMLEIGISSFSNSRGIFLSYGLTKIIWSSQEYLIEESGKKVVLKPTCIYPQLHFKFFSCCFPVVLMDLNSPVSRMGFQVGALWRCKIKELNGVNPLGLISLIPGATLLPVGLASTQGTAVTAAPAVTPL